MPFATGAFSVKPAFRLEYSANVIGWEPNPSVPGGYLALVEMIVGIRRTSGSATDSGTGSVDVGNGGAGDTKSFYYNFASTDYIQIYRSTWKRATTVTADVWSAVVTSSTTLGTATATVGSMTYPPYTAATQPSFSPTPFNAGTSITVALPRVVGTYTHDVMYSFGSIVDALMATGQGTSYSFTPPLSLAAEIPGAAEGPFTVTAITRTAGGTEVGRMSFTGTLRVPSSQAPTVSAYAVSDANATVSTQVGAFVQTLSVLKLDSVTATPKQGSTIADLRLTIEGQDLPINGTRALFNSGTIPVTARAIDSRGLEGTLGGNVTVLAYTPPIVGVVLPAAPSGSVYRSNGSGVYDANGQNLAFKLVGSVASLINGTEKNSFTVRISTRPIDSSTWTVRNTTTPTTTTSGGRINAASQTIVVGGGAIYLNDNSYVVRVEVYDKFNSIVQDTTIATSFVTIDLNGSKVGVGKLHERGALDVGGDGYFQGLYAVYSTITNANNASDGGAYQINSVGASNLPAGLAAGPFIIRVDRYVTTPGIEAVIQRLSEFLDPQRVTYTRIGISTTGSSSVTFDPWVAYLRPGHLAFDAVQVQNNGSGTITSSGSMGAPTGITVSTSITSPVATRAKISLGMQGYGSAAGTSMTLGIAASGVTTITPTVGSSATVKFTSESTLAAAQTASNSWFINLNAGTTVLSLVGQVEGVAGTRTIRYVNLLVEPVPIF